MSKNKNQNTTNFQCLYCNDPFSSKELVALTDDRFSLIEGSKLDDLNFKIIDFIIHNQQRLCTLEKGLIEKGEQIFVCGRIMSIDNDYNDVSIPVKLIGPLNEWWFSGFDSGSSIMFGIESLYALYLLQNPHEIYQPMFAELSSKMYLTKYIIEILQNNPDCCIDELLSLLKNKSEQFTISFLMSSLKFIIDHIINYDNFSDTDELQLSQTPLFKILNELSSSNVLSDKSIQNFIDKCCIINNINTEYSQMILDNIFNNIITNSEPKFKDGNFSTKELNANVENGCFVKIGINKKIFYGRIIYQNKENFHLNLFVLGNNTLLGETLPKNVLFATENCIDIARLSINSFEQIDCKLMNISSEQELMKAENFICFQIYDEKRCIFRSIPMTYLSKTNDFSCLGCLKKEEENCQYSIGDCIIIPYMEDLNIPYFNHFQVLQGDFKMDEKESEIYPEKIRKKDQSINNCYLLEDLMASRFIIGYINDIVCNNQQHQIIKVNVFFRPENVFENFEDYIRSDWNVLYWTEIVCKIDSELVYRKCQVIYSDKNFYSIYNDEFFYFNKCYKLSNQIFYNPSENIKTKFIQQLPVINHEKFFNILDLFSGCGGLSYGFVPIASKLYAIEKEKSAAQCYKNNYESSLVFNMDANLILKMLIEKNDQFLLEKLPKIGEIDIIIGGPPCQGFSQMNRFSFSEYSLFKRSSIVCYLNFLELYRPSYFLFENVYNMIYYGKSLIFKIICSFMIRLGYQISIAILQAGSYGLPQNRKRLFIIGAQAGLTLPKFPIPTHQFSLDKSKTTFKINNQVFKPFNKESKGVLRMITIQDAIGDLVPLNPNDYYLELPREYNDFNCHYQKIMKKSNLIMDHYCAIISELNFERIKRIPIIPGSDWRDLPNIQLVIIFKYFKKVN